MASPGRPSPAFERGVGTGKLQQLLVSTPLSCAPRTRSIAIHLLALYGLFALLREPYRGNDIENIYDVHYPGLFPESNWTRDDRLSYYRHSGDGICNGTAGACNSHFSNYLEELMYKFGSDKSRDDHMYVDLYKMLFDPIRLEITSVAEFGIAAGQSLQAWYRYFPNAQIRGYDVITQPSTTKVAERLRDRVRFDEADLLDPQTDLPSFGFSSPNSFDVLIEDALHTLEMSQAFLVKFFPFLRPGGYYIIEDVTLTHRGQEEGRVWQQAPEKLRPEVQQILQQHDAVFVDTHIGHRAWGEWVRRSGKFWARDHVRHNSYLVVIRKRAVPPPPVKINQGDVAMRSDKVLIDDQH